MHKHIIAITYASVVTLVLTALVSFTYVTMKEDMAQYKEDMKCIHVLVKQGIKRKDITQENGVCVIKEDIYYKSINK